MSKPRVKRTHPTQAASRSVVDQWQRKLRKLGAALMRLSASMQRAQRR